VRRAGQGAVTEASPAGFAGFPSWGLDFLDELGRRQDRAWFQENRATYEEAVRGPMIALVGALGPELAARRVPLAADPTRALFRIQRDVRFARDTLPYNAHASAALTRDGARQSPGVLYVQIDPAGSFMAAGFFRPPPPELARIRHAIASHPARWRRVLATLAEARLALAADETMLKRLPAGFDPGLDTDVAEAVRRRSFIVRRTLPRSGLGRPALVARIADFARDGLPLLAFGWEALKG
jgi:uncharacterized protein (TIGR02453 family)